MAVVAEDYTPQGTEADLIEFNVVGVGKFQLPVLGEHGVPFGITNAFGLFEQAQDTGDDRQKVAAWSYLIDTLRQFYPAAVRTLSGLGQTDVAAIFTRWGELSKGYNPKADPSQLSSAGTEQT